MKSAKALLAGGVALLAIKLGLATVLTISGFVHIGNSLLFLSAVLGYDLAGPGMAIVGAALLPFLQITIAVALITQLNNNYREGLAWATFLFGFYCLVQVIAYGRDLDISCGCFGTASERIGPKSLAWSIGGLVLSVFGMYLSWKVASSGNKTPIPSMAKICESSRA